MLKFMFFGLVIPENKGALPMAVILCFERNIQ